MDCDGDWHHAFVQEGSCKGSFKGCREDRSISHLFHLLHKEKLKGMDIIRLKDYKQIFFVSEKFKEMFERNKFTGYSFEEVDLSCYVLHKDHRGKSSLKIDKIKGAVWHFFRSPRTGKIGPTAPLKKALEKEGIKYIIYK